MNRPVSRKIKHKAHSEQANALAIVVVFAIALFGFAGLSVDLGNVYVQRHKLQEATDAAALAAVVDWASGLGNAAAVQTGNRFAIANGTRSNDSVSVTTGTWNNGTRAFNPGGSGSVTQAPAVRVTAQRTVPTPFARIVGLGAMSPRVQSIAVAGRAAAAIHVLPFAVCDEAGTIAQAPCTPITIKYSPQDAGTNSCGVDSTSANFGVLRLGDNTGSDDYRDTVVNGYGGTLRVGDCVSTETGNMNGPTKQAVLERIAGIPPYVCTVNPPSPPPKNARMIILPKVSNLNVNGSGQVCITGFYVAVLDSVDDKANVQARFLSVFASDQVDPGTTMTPGVLSGVGLVK